MSAKLKSALLGLALGTLLPLRAPAQSAPVFAHATISVISADGGLTGEQVTEQGKLIGLVGDPISFSSGEHMLRVSAARRYSLEIGLTVSAGAARVTNYAATPPPCATMYEVNWAPPSVFSTKKKPRAAAAQPSLSTGGLLLKIATPTFGAAQGKSGCSFPMSLSCQEQYATVRFASDPTGAEIWIGNEKQDAAAPSTLSVPFCPKRDIVHVMLRVPGLTTCPQDVKLSGASLIDVRCALRAPSLSEGVETNKKP